MKMLMDIFFNHIFIKAFFNKYLVHLLLFSMFTYSVTRHHNNGYNFLINIEISKLVKV